MNKIELNSESARDVMSVALFQAITPEDRNQLLQRAMIEVLKKEEGYKIQTIQTIFTEVIKEMARERCIQLLKEDNEFAKIMEDTTKNVLNEVIIDIANKLRDNIISNLEAMKKQRW